MGKFERHLPLNGEIVDVTASESGEPGGSRQNDFVDAEFEEIGAAGDDQQRNRVGEMPAPATAPMAVDGLSMLKRQAGEKVAARGGAAFYLAGAAIAFMAFWIAGGYAVFPTLLHIRAPDSPRAVPRIGDISTSTVTINRHRILLVSGTIFNDSSETAKLPPVKIVVTTKSGKTVTYRLGSRSWPLGPGESMPFSSRLDAPATGVESVRVGLSGKGNL